MAVVLLTLVAAAPVYAGETWRQVIRTGVYARQRAALVAEGDRYLNEAQQQTAQTMEDAPTPPIVLRAARNAVAAYERALEMAEDTDVHYRAFFAATFIDSRQTGICAGCRDGFEAVLRHADAILRLDPNSMQMRELAYQSCMALSKLGGLVGPGPEADAYFERALLMYVRWRGLVDDFLDQRNAARARAGSYANAAELLMALGRLDEAIDFYRRAVELYPSEALHHFGLGVAYDRDGQWAKARAALRTAYELAGRDMEVLKKPNVFFIPLGDYFYYLAVTYEVLGNRDIAIANYNRFLTRSAGNRYLDRAREHLQELEKGAPRP